MAGNTQSSLEQPPPPLPQKDKEVSATDKREISFSPHECSVQGGGHITVTFPESVPGGRILVTLKGTCLEHHLTADKVDDNTVSVPLPAHEHAEVVSLKIFRIADPEKEDDRIILIDDTFVFTDPTGYMAELLIQSVTDTQAVPLLYSVLPPLATYGPDELRLFDSSLTAAVKKEKLPKHWNVLGKKRHGQRTGCSSTGDTLLHFAAYSQLPQLFAHLLSLPGGKEAVEIANYNNQLPLHLAQENGCQQIIGLIKKMGCAATKPLDDEDYLPSGSNEHLKWLRSINSDWISQRSSSLITTAIPPVLSLAPPSPDHPKRRKSASVMEELRGNTAATYSLNRARKRNWSRVVGSGNSRSVDTGLNELHRISAELILHEKMAEVRPDVGLPRQLTSSSTSSDTTHISNSNGDSALTPIVRRTSSCPVQFDNLSSQLIHSTITSPGLIGRFSASPSINGDNDTSAQTSPTLPHTAIVTSTSNSESVSPLTVPSLCMEDTETSQRFCVPVGLTVLTNERPYSAGMSRVSHKSESAVQDIDAEEEDEVKEPGGGGDSPILASVSAPDLLVVATDSEDKDSPPLPPKQIPSTNVLVCVPPRKASPQLSSKSFSGKDQPQVRAKRHKKSFSVSGVKMFMDDGSREDEVMQGTASALSVSPGEMENRSRGSSLLSTSSKTGSSVSDDMGAMEDDYDDDVIRVLSPPNKLTVRKPSPLNEKKISAVVTNIDDYSASSDDEDRLRTTYWEKQPDSDITPTNTLSFSTHSPGTRGRRANWKQPVDDVDSGKAADENAEVNLSDIDVRMDSLNNSQSTAQFEQAMAQVSNGVPPGTPPLHLRRESCPSSPSAVMPLHPKLTPTSSSERTPPSARSTIGQLKKLLLEEEGVTNAASQSDDSDRESTPKFARKKIQTLPSGRSTPPPKLTRNKGSLTLNKVSRNPSSASDSIIFTSQISKEADITSLDFQQSPTDPSSPCESPRIQRTNPDHPPSPLSLAKSPRSNSPLLRSGEDIKIPEISPLKNAVKASLSPLEKHVSRSADNLLLEDHDKEPERVLLTEDGERTVKHLRFKEDESRVVGKRNKGDKPGEKEPSRLVKLFRRDSKRTSNKMSKNDSSTSLDACPVDDDPAKKYELARAKASKTRPPPIQDVFTPPLASPGRKPRSATIHGDCNLPHSVSLDFEQPMISLQPVQPYLSNDPSPVPVSPISKTEPEPPAEVEVAPIIVAMEDHPELEMSMNEEKTWYQTIDRRLRKSMSKHEKARQGAIYDLIRTERHYLRSLLVMKLVFRDKLKTEFSEEIIDNLFPYLDQLMDISREFSDRLFNRQQNSTNVIGDISDILFDQFTEEKGRELFTVYSGFVCLQPAAVEYYKELLRKKPRFVRLINGLYSNKHCERRKLPDFYLLITQRVAKYVEIMKRIVKETEVLGLDHIPRLKHSSKALIGIVEAVDIAVFDYTTRKELEDIQSRLEISVSSHTRKGSWSRKELKRLDLLAQDRTLLKKGEAVWQGHGKQLNVHVVLVTDCLVLLTEKDQKLNIAGLLDSKYPVIKLYDLHVRVNASVKSGVQLLLLEQGDHPEMFRLEFITKKMAKQWEEALNKAVEHCRKNNLTCDCLSADTLMSGDDEVKGEEEEVDGDIVEPLRSDLSPTTLRRMQIQESVDLATRLLSTEDPVALHRHSVASSSASSTPTQKSNRPSRSATLYEQRRGNEVPELKKRLSKKTPERNKTMKEKDRGAVGHDSWDRERQAMLDCIAKLKDSIDYLTEQNDRKDKQIEKLRQDVTDMKQERRQASDSDSSPVMTRNTSSHAPFGRPHSVHYDLLDNPPDFSHLSPATARKRSKLTLAPPAQHS